MKLALVVLVSLSCLITIKSQDLFIKNLEDINFVKCHSENRFLIQSVCNNNNEPSIVASVGEIQIFDSLLIWSNINNCNKDPFLIVNSSDTISFSIVRESTPIVSLAPNMSHRNVSDYLEVFSGLKIESNSFEILDFDLIFYNRMNPNPIYIKNRGAKLNKLIQKQVDTYHDSCKLIISNIKLHNITNNTISIVNEEFTLSSRYFRHNESESIVKLKAIRPLTVYILNEDIEKVDSSCWLAYKVGNGYTNLIDKQTNEIRASYLWISSDKVHYKHYLDNIHIFLGNLELKRRSYFDIVVDFNTYDEYFVEFKELVKSGIWQEFNDAGVEIVQRTYNEDGVLIAVNPN